MNYEKEIKVERKFVSLKAWECVLWKSVLGYSEFHFNKLTLVCTRERITECVDKMWTNFEPWIDVTMKNLHHTEDSVLFKAMRSIIENHPLSKTECGLWLPQFDECVKELEDILDKKPKRPEYRS